MRAVHGRAARVRRDPPIAARAHGARPHATDGTARTRVARRPNTRQDKGCEAVTDRGSAVTASVARMPRRSRRSPRRSRHSYDAVATQPRRSRRINTTLRVIETLRAPVRHLCAGAFCVQARALSMRSRIPANCPKAGSEPGDCLVGARGGWQRHGTRPRAPRDRTHRRGSASTLERDPCRCDECQWIESQRPRAARAPARSAQRSSAREVAEDSRPRARDSCATPRVRGRPGCGFPLRSMRMGLCLRGAPARRR